MNVVSAPHDKPSPSRPGAGQTIRIGFLYNHEAAHQVRHSAVVIPALIERYPTLEITVIATSDTLLDAVREVYGPGFDSHVRVMKLTIPGWHAPVARVLDKVSPFSRLDHLYSNRALFAQFDALIVTEGTSLFLRRLRGLEGLKIIRIDHGAGDRSIGYQPSFSGNDLILIAGAKQRDRFLKLGYVRENQIAVVGYTKFDAINVAAGRAKKLFANDKPVVLYNPHPDPKLSSWYRMGRDVLDFFYECRDYNLIFAPHVMLFRRRVHISLESPVISLRRDLPKKYLSCPNIHIDLGSPSSIDMTYTLAADIYIGDASSQVYEFLIDPRPCIYLNAHNARWQDDPNYAFWRFGQVLHDARHLREALKNAASEHSAYRHVQESAFRETFDMQAAPSSVRAAEVIAAFVQK